jgi:hypothetical protein
LLLDQRRQMIAQHAGVGQRLIVRPELVAQELAQGHFG